MGMEANNKSEIISRIIADLSVQSRGGEELSAKIRSLRDELKKVIENEDTIFGKIRGLVESFREIIPEEKQRYNAAIKALSTTSKLSRQEVVKAVDNQLEEIKILEKSFLSALPGRRGEYAALEAKSREIKDEISKLRERLGQLENEEKEILNGMAAREQEVTLVEKAVGELFTDIRSDITNVKKKVEESTASTIIQPSIPAASPAVSIEIEVAQPSPPTASVTSDVPVAEKGSVDQKVEVSGISAPSVSQQVQETQREKRCPMCGTKMTDNGERWRCYACAYEEVKTVKVGIEQKIEISAPSEAQEPQEPQKDAGPQKKCPMCGGQMHDYGPMWQCYVCAYEESKEGKFPDKGGEKKEPARAPEPTPASESIFDNAIPTLSSREYREPVKEPIQGSIQGEMKESSPHKKPVAKKKTCPSCGKKMNFFEEEQTWRCSSCEYERKI